MPRRPDPSRPPAFAKRVIVDRAAYNQWMRDYRARKRAEVVARAAAQSGDDIVTRPGEYDDDPR